MGEEIAQMTGQAAAPIGTVAGGQSFAMPDMFASPGLTMVGGQQGEFSQPAASASTVAAATTFEPAAAEPVPAEPAAPAKSSDKKKKIGQEEFQEEIVIQEEVQGLLLS